jgi:hypothetical protein
MATRMISELAYAFVVAPPGHVTRSVDQRRIDYSNNIIENIYPGFRPGSGIIAAWLDTCQSRKRHHTDSGIGGWRCMAAARNPAGRAIVGVKGGDNLASNLLNGRRRSLIYWVSGMPIRGFRDCSTKDLPVSGSP